MSTKHPERKQSKAAKINPEPDSQLLQERIAKRIARAGLCSRREAETWITQGRIKLNGAVLTSPAVTVTDLDVIEVDGEPLIARDRTRLWLLNKPAGTVTTNKDPEGRKTVFDILPAELPRLITVGRLDINTEGLILMTNDGGLARVLELPSTGWLRRYRVRAHGKVTDKQLATLADGIAVDGMLYGAIEASVERRQGANTWLVVALREGKNREVKKVLAHLGLQVNRLIRISFGPFQLGELGPGEIREIRSRTLRQQLGERLIKQAGADFSSPIAVAREKKIAAEKKPPGAKRKKGLQALKRGAVREETLSRLTTKRREKKSGPQKPRSQGRKAR